MTNDWSMYWLAAGLNSRGFAAQEALLFNTDYNDVSPKASHCAGCIVILSIVFPLSAPTWRASPSLFRPFTLAALVTGENYRFFNRTAVRLNVFSFFATNDGQQWQDLCFNMANSRFFNFFLTHLNTGSWFSGGKAALKHLSSWPLGICVIGTERHEKNWDLLEIVKNESDVTLGI